MDKGFLKDLKIDDTLPPEQIVSQLAAKRREFTEMMNGEENEDRRASLSRRIDRISENITDICFETGVEEPSDDDTDKKDEVSIGGGAPVNNVQSNSSSVQYSNSVAPPPPAPAPVNNRSAAPVNNNRSQPVNNTSNNHQASVELTEDEVVSYAFALDHNKDYANAYNIFSQLAENGNIDAQRMTGYYHCFGLGTPANPERGEFWLKKAVESGSVIALYMLGIVYLDLIPKGMSPTSRKAKKRYKEGLAFLEQAAEKGNINAMIRYVELCEMKYKTVPDPGHAIIRSLLKSKHRAKAIGYCDTLTEEVKDSFDKTEWEKRKKLLKKRKPYTGSNAANDGSYVGGKRVKSSGGCGCGTVVLAVVIFAVLCVIGSAIYSFVEKKRMEAAPDIVSSKAENVVVVDTFGTENIDMFAIPLERRLGSECVTTDLIEMKERAYTVDGEVWDRAYLFRAGNGQPTAYMDYDIGDTFSGMTFTMAPLLDQDSWTTNGIVRVTDLDTDEVIYEYELTEEVLSADVVVDVAGHSNIRISVTVADESGLAPLSYVLIKDPVLHLESVN